MRDFSVWYIPYNKLLNDDPQYYTKWMAVMADNKGDAKQMGRQDGLVTKVELLNKNKKTIF